MEQRGEIEVEFVALKPELLTDVEWENLRKMSTSRLRSKLVKEGYDKELVAEVTQREELIAMVVECAVENKRVEIEKQATEKKEKEEKQAREQKEEQERTIKMKELEVKKLQLEREDIGRREEIRMREAEIERNTKKDEDEAKRLDSNDLKAKRYGDALRGCVAKMPSDPIEILPWFRSVEKIFTDFKIEDQFQVHLLKPHFTEVAAALVARLDPTIASDFKQVKDAILHEFKLSPSELLHRFSTIVKNRDETFVLYSNRLKSLLLYYLESRKCSDYQTLIDLLVCDRIKQTLSESVLRYTLSLESSRDGSWMPLKDLTSNLDIYNDTHVDNRPRHVVGAMGGG
jgi:hypothetical protein